MSATEQGHAPTGAVAYKGTADAATAVGVSEKTLRRALANTDPKKYPPPLVPDGRHGKAGSYAFLADTLADWVRSLREFA
jgi:hypothetical protein